MIDFLNPEFVRSHLVPYSERQEGELFIQEQRSIEDGFVKKRIAIREDGRPERHYLEQVKLYRLEQFQHLLALVGLQLDQVYGDYDGQAYHPDQSRRLIMIGHRPDLSDAQGVSQ